MNDLRGQPWMKRMRWSDAGLVAMNQRFDTLLSLWIEGAISGDEAREEFTRLPWDSGLVDLRAIPRTLETVVSLMFASAYLQIFDGFIDLAQSTQANTLAARKGIVQRLSRALRLPLHDNDSISTSKWFHDIIVACPVDDSTRYLRHRFTRWLDGDLESRSFLSTCEDCARKAAFRMADLDPNLEPLAQGETAMKARIQALALARLAEYCEENNVLPDKRVNAMQELFQAIDNHNRPRQGPSL